MTHGMGFGVSGRVLRSWRAEVVLSEAAAQLRAAFIERGFRHRRLFHGTENPFIPSILSGGFMTTDGALGTGIYLAETFAHAQCYAPGDRGGGSGL